MNKLRLSLSLLLILVSLAVNFSKAQTSDRPNVIVIMADDIGFECYSAYGSKFYSTPNIDRLAKTGAHFTQAYSQPICTPSRVKIMTGRYNFRNYTTFGELDLTQPTFAKMVKANGYSTAIAGKWQLSMTDLKGPYKAGFDEYFLWHFAGNQGPHADDPQFKNKGSRFKSPKLYRDTKLVPNTKDKYGPDLVTDYIIDFIERKKNDPFVLYYPMMLVHSPFDPTPDSPDWIKPDKARDPRDRFREMVAYMDKTIGRIVDKLDSAGIRENTLILITGDNGTNRAIASPFPERGEIQGGKGSMTDAGTHVAFVANWKNHIKPNTIIDSPISFSDVMPTIGEATGSPIPKTSDGRSFLPQLKGNAKNARDWIFMSYSKNGLKKAPYRCFVRDQRWKLYSDGTLYDVPNDWLEESPATGPEAEKARQRLQPTLDRIINDAPQGQIQF